MKRGSTVAVSLITVVIAAGVCHAQDIKSFLSTHKSARGQAGKGDWQGAAKSYGRFASENPADPYASLACVLRGIILCRELKDIGGARLAFDEALKTSDTPAGRETGFAARAWLARFRMLEIREALHTYYVDEVEYPRRLKELAERKLMPEEELLDPWGEEYFYHPKKLRMAPKVPRQSYTLKCKSIRGRSRDLDRILGESAELEGRYRLGGITGSDRITAMLVRTGEATKWEKVVEGDSIGTVKVIDITQNAVILADNGIMVVVTK